MFLLPDQIKTFLDAHERILDTAREWINKMLGPSHRRISEVRWNGAVFEYEFNSACHCHPEYTWSQLTTEQNQKLLDELTQYQLIDDPYDENDDGLDKVLVMSSKPR